MSSALPSVVVVDDSADAAEMLAAALEVEGFEPHVAYDGVHALEIVERVQPLAVLLDVSMPGMDGAQLAAELRRRHGDALVLIAVSGVDPGDPAARRAYDGVDYFLRKPIDFARLRQLLG